MNIEQTVLNSEWLRYLFCMQIKCAKLFSEKPDVHTPKQNSTGVCRYYLYRKFASYSGLLFNLKQ